MVPITCGSCGTTLEEEDAGLNPDERKPCPACGSTVRSHRVTISLAARAEMRASAGVISGNMRSVAGISDLLLQAVVVSGDRTDEGRLIEAVAIPWFDIIDLLGKDPNIAYEIPDYRWEEIIAGAYRKSGFEEVTLTPRSGDRGRDVIAVKKRTWQHPCN
jgi:restriction system protein